ncbi:MAG TPA: hypothetical protein VFV05_09890 [Methylomirabilota bacterium]|nr:hypothetical protein [Methylomirabilota bacterium]
MSTLRAVAVAVAVPLLTAGLAFAQAAGSRSEESLRAFASVAEVMRHPRCLNCHPGGDFPRQTDDRHRHRMLVARGPDGFGTPAMRCTTCHQQANTADGRVPGAPSWHLAPRSMGWEGLTDGELCRALKDVNRNGHRPLPDLVKHMLTDPLVQWAWSPGDRTIPPIPRHEFHETFKRWVSTGAACPG